MYLHKKPKLVASAGTVLMVAGKVSGDPHSSGGTSNDVGYYVVGTSKADCQARFEKVVGESLADYVSMWGFAGFYTIDDGIEV